MNFIVFILGLSVGSFINMAVWRLGHKKSLLKDQRSYCDFCKKPLKIYDNIPLLSFLIYKGKSRCCGKKLPFSYPIVELLMGIVFVLEFKSPPIPLFEERGGIMMIVTFLILTVMMFEAVFDFYYLSVPDEATFSLIGLGIIHWFFTGMSKEKVISAILAALFMWMLTKIKFKGQQAMGEGDIFLVLFMGLFLGYPGILVAMYLAFISGAVVGVILMLFRKKEKLSPIPFGPFLMFGTVIAYWWGENILSIIGL